jgi:hypothetical protein
MAIFKEMNPEDVFKALEGQKDILTGAIKERDDFYSTFHCPRCNGDLHKEFDSKHTFDGKSIVPRALLRCEICKYLIDPHSNLVVETGDPSKVKYTESPLILKSR